MYIPAGHPKSSSTAHYDLYKMYGPLLPRELRSQRGIMYEGYTPRLRAFFFSIPCITLSVQLLRNRKKKERRKKEKRTKRKGKTEIRKEKKRNPPNQIPKRCMRR
ncbi:hypothetical protein P168DRAFT_117133 [Aspergillus campestris IBT 28561]|uniref:Uncharacterized protein n=1 Tax=Aspergillus campestris (strain IBT 28561) TaxID=1392248 RepID=A0A2I1D9Y3_ASPC2|nr:uncharacterized protein P168DRAFT_117133 [Aspergillus campestris IBT 28561]PKY06679.1 hypothetical protein P168DRAFT_117133 [Aspergillus campestris IBT 28561]